VWDSEDIKDVEKMVDEEEEEEEEEEEKEEECGAGEAVRVEW